MEKSNWTGNGEGYALIKSCDNMFSTLVHAEPFQQVTCVGVGDILNTGKVGSELSVLTCHVTVSCRLLLLPPLLPPPLPPPPESTDCMEGTLENWETHSSDACASLVWH